MLAASDLLTMPHAEREALPIEDVSDFVRSKGVKLDWGSSDEGLRMALRGWIITELVRQRIREVESETGVQVW